MGSNASIPADQAAEPTQQLRKVHLAKNNCQVLKKPVIQSASKFALLKHFTLGSMAQYASEHTLHNLGELLPRIIYKTTQSFKWKVTFNLKLISEIHPTSKTSAAMATLKWMERRCNQSSVEKVMVSLACWSHSALVLPPVFRLRRRPAWQGFLKSFVSPDMIQNYKETAKVKKAGSWKFVWRVCQHSKDHDHFPLWRRKDGIHSLTSGLMTLTPRIR